MGWTGAPSLIGAAGLPRRIGADSRMEWTDARSRFAGRLSVSGGIIVSVGWRITGFRLPTSLKAG